MTDRFKDLEARLQTRVVGQQDAVRAVARRLLLNKGPLKEGFDRPDGPLLFLGPTGVGKTELAKAVAEFLFGDEKKMVRVDMSEYQDGTVGMPITAQCHEGSHFVVRVEGGELTVMASPEGIRDSSAA